MRIAVNTRFLLSSKMEGFGWYTYEVVRRMVQNHPEHTFLFFFDRAYDPSFIFGDNVQAIVLRPQARHPLLFKFWFNVSVKRALKKYKADVFFSPDGYLSLTSSVPQVGVIHDINFEHNPQDIPKGALKYLQHYFPLFARKAAHLLTVSEYSRQDIVRTYGISEEKITVAWNGASETFQPIDLAARKEVQEKYAEGNAYLLFVGALHPRKNVGRLLEAFARYKVLRPDEHIRLVIVGEKMFAGQHSHVKIPAEIASQIHFTGHLPLTELALVMAAAEVFTFVPYFEGFGIPLVEAMRCGTPILAGNRTSLPEVAGDAAIYCDPFSVDDILEKMLFICDNASERERLSQLGLERSSLFSWDRSAQIAWEVIEGVGNPKH